MLKSQEMNNQVNRLKSIVTPAVDLQRPPQPAVAESISTLLTNKQPSRNDLLDTLLALVALGLYATYTVAYGRCHLRSGIGTRPPG